MTTDFDVIVIGGGVAGLAGALALSRARRTVLVIDAGSPRNLPANHTHGFLTRDGSTPTEMVELGTAELRHYGNDVLRGEVTSVDEIDGGYRVTTAAESHTARRLLITTGLVDVLPDVPGLAELWGRDVVHCPYCFGWELRDQPIGILGSDHGAMQALMWRQWSDDVVLFQHTAAAPAPEERERLAARGIRVVEGVVTAVATDGGRLSGVVVGGEVVPRSVLVVAPRYEARRTLVDQLGVEIVEHPRGIGHQVAADATGRTAARGIWAAGNTVDVALGILQSAASGATAGAAINADLTEADTVCAVAEASWKAA